MDDLEEDTYFGDKIRRIADKAVAKFVPDELGGTKAKKRNAFRDEASNLYKKWKEAEVEGLEKNTSDMNTFLKREGGSPEVLARTAQVLGDKVRLSARGVTLDNSDIRDVVQAFVKAKAYIERSSDPAAQHRDKNSENIKDNAAVNYNQDNTLKGLQKELKKLRRDIEKLKRG